MLATDGGIHCPDAAVAALKNGSESERVLEK
jgi:hypothetical protein